MSKLFTGGSFDKKKSSNPDKTVKKTRKGTHPDKTVNKTRLWTSCEFVSKKLTEWKALKMVGKFLLYTPSKLYTVEQFWHPLSKLFTPHPQHRIWKTILKFFAALFLQLWNFRVFLFLTFFAKSFNKVTRRDYVSWGTIVEINPNTEISPTDCNNTRNLSKEWLILLFG